LHYRSPHMMGIDADYAMHRAFVYQGWPVFVVIDPDGLVRFHGFDSDRNLSALRRCLEGLVDKTPAVAGEKAPPGRGLAMPAEVLACRQARRERSPRLAFNRAGQAHVVYYSNREGANAVFLRRFNQQGEPAGEERLSPANAECYAPDCAFDPQGALWVAWCARQSGCYDIYAHCRPVGKPPSTEQLSFSTDDAMSPKIAAGPDGTVTVAYYKWHILWGYSRDRDLYARTYEPGRLAWGKETEISPHEPEVEDHTDPDVVIDRQGNAWIVWSYDYHPQLYKQPLDAAQPTIFAARFFSNTVSAPILVGATGEFRYAIDLFPSAALDERGVLWCAWDCSEPSRCLRLARLNQPANAFTLVSTFGARSGVCSTPELAPAAGNLLLLAWSQRGPSGLWQGRAALLKDGQSLAQTTLVEPADVLFPQAQQSPDGQYWVAYEKSDAKGSDLVLRNITRELQRAQPEAARAP